MPTQQMPTQQMPTQQMPTQQMPTQQMNPPKGVGKERKEKTKRKGNVPLQTPSFFERMKRALACEQTVCATNSAEEIVTKSTSEEESITTEGGFTQLLDENGNIYKGQIKNGVREGKGTMYYTATGDVYDGTWANSLPHGEGTLTRGDGMGAFEGHWENGVLQQVKTGLASVVDKHGNHYEGSFQNWKKHGRGTLTKIDGEIYVGNWSFGVRQGFGAVTYPDGSRFEGLFEDGKQTNKGQIFEPPETPEYGPQGIYGPQKLHDESRDDIQQDKNQARGDVKRRISPDEKMMQSRHNQKEHTPRKQHDQRKQNGPSKQNDPSKQRKDESKKRHKDSQYGSRLPPVVPPLFVNMENSNATDNTKKGKAEHNDGLREVRDKAPAPSQKEKLQKKRSGVDDGRAITRKSSQRKQTTNEQSQNKRGLFNFSKKSKKVPYHESAKDNQRHDYTRSRRGEDAGVGWDQQSKQILSSFGNSLEDDSFDI